MGSIRQIYINYSFDFKNFYRNNTKKSNLSYHKNLIVIFGLIIFSFFILIQTKTVYGYENNHNKDYYDNEIDEFIYTDRYKEFLEKYKNNMGSGKYHIDATDYSSIDDDEYGVISVDGVGKILEVSENGVVTYSVDIDKKGLYSISLTYYTKEGKSSDIERAIFINDKLQYQEARLTSYERFFENYDDGINTDNRGNELKPRQVEKQVLNTKFAIDAEGYFTEPLLFYFEEGVNTISLVSISEPMALKNIAIYNENPKMSYKEYLNKYSDVSIPDKTLIKIEAEDAVLKSSPMLYPMSDNSTPVVTPYDAKLIKINSIGGNNYKNTGQWIEWELEVDSDGMYEIDLVQKQNFSRGATSSRRLLIDNEIPFVEMDAITFVYNKNYVNTTISDEENNPYKFYLTEGKHTLRLEVTYGKTAEFMEEIEEGTKNLNEIYRKILMITGPEPDRYRDYQLKAKYPELENELQIELDRFDNILKSLEEVTGGRSDREAVLVTIISQLGDLTENAEDIPKYLGDFKTNIGSLGTYLQQVKEQPLQLDKIYVRSGDVEKVELNDGWFASFKHSMLRLYYSFIVDYNSIGDVSEDEDRTVTVWLGSATAGRDQANVLKALIDEKFTKESGIKVNLMLVQMDSLLPATLSGQGPDIALGVNNDLPMNYGLRSALQDLSEFDDFDEIKQRFHSSAMVPYKYGDSYFALSETESFYMLFYRKDVFSELGLTPPKTWDDVIESLSILAKNNLQFGLPANTEGELMMTYAMLLYQNNGQFYDDDGESTGIDDEIGVETFRTLTEYFTQYTLERDYNFYNRFRTGEMPIGIADYTFYNQLQVSAPEIKGLWEFVSVPGTEYDDGTINNTVAAGGTGVIMLNNSQVKDEAWEFMKWWTSAETQSDYGRELESLMGPAARYPTANVEAIQLLPWPSRDYNNIMAQFENLEGIPQVPGGYYTSRNINNAFYKTVIEKEIGPREAITDSSILIDEEITNKRKELGLYD